MTFWSCATVSAGQADRNGICLMEYGICKTNLKYLDTKNNPPMEDKWQYYIMLAISNILLK
ncbi:MAG: hypothetical protein ACYDEE_09840 [Ignavibacteriaceae bacterium]